AMTQNNLGTALWTLGARERGTERLDEAVTAYRAALEEWTQERVPLDWAGTQNNLADVHRAYMEKCGVLGDASGVEHHRKTGLAHIEQALTVFNIETTPAYHAMATSIKDALIAF
ncbi:MAG: hypothetical protein AAF035_12800, partial [Pseudomonadota bacterium]